MAKSERNFENGLKTENRAILIKGIINALIANKMSPKFTEEQIIEVYEQCSEMQDINIKLGKKTTMRDLIKLQLG